jgi:surface antigen
MAWGIPKIGTVAEANGGALTLTEPTGTAQGDLQIACIAIRSTVGFTNSDWTKIEGQLSGNTVSTGAGIASGEMWYRIRGASAGTLQFSRTGGDVARGCIISYTGGKQDLAAVLGNHSSNTLGSASTTATTGTISTTEADELIVAMVAAGDNYTNTAFDAATDPTTASGATDTTNAPSAGTWRERVDSGTNTGADTGIGIADAMRATAGATGTIQSTVSGSARHVMIAAAFKMLVAVDLAMSLGTATWAGFAPTVSSPTTVTPGAGAASWQGFAPTVGLPVTVTPGVGAASWQGFAPTVDSSVTLTIPPGDATWAGFAPSVLVPDVFVRGGSNSKVTATVLTVTVTPGVGAGSWQGFAPTIGLPITITPGVGSSTWAGFAPTVQLPITLTPGVGAATWQGFAPSVSSPTTVSPGLGTSTWQGFAPAIGLPLTVTIPRGDATWQGFAPSLTLAITVTPGLGTATWQGFAPTVHLPITVTPGAGASLWAGFAPTVTTPITVTPGVGTSSWSGFPPDVSTQSGTTVQPGTGIGTWEGFAPSLEQVILVHGVVTLLSPSAGAVVQGAGAQAAIVDTRSQAAPGPRADATILTPTTRATILEE